MHQLRKTTQRNATHNQLSSQYMVIYVLFFSGGSTPACPYRRFPSLYFAFFSHLDASCRTTQGNKFDREVTLVVKYISRRQTVIILVGLSG